ncbi:MAG: ribokinase [Bacteroidota bacterium]|nr:ribokinase [Bacteroidota bacterium]
MKPDILIIGSSNTDMVIQAERLPAAGETILGGRFFMNPGGKGANQAVAAARLGGHITFIAKTGNDIFGRQSLQLFNAEGINTSHMLSDLENPSGVALITVDKNAENCIVVASGANASLSEKDLLPAKTVIENAGIILMQLEIPLETVRFVAQMAAEKGVMVVLNPAPACILPAGLLNQISVITPNEKEAEMLTGIGVDNMESARRAAQKIKDQGVETVIITLGSKGALLFHENEYTHVPGCVVKAIDTTAAGDVFNGALVVALSEGKNMQESTRFACQAAAISVTKLGAQASAPYRKEVDEFRDAGKYPLAIK